VDDAGHDYENCPDFATCRHGARWVIESLTSLHKKADRIMALVAVEQTDLDNLAAELNADDSAIQTWITNALAQIAAGTPLTAGDLSGLTSAVAATAALVPASVPLPAPVAVNAKVGPTAAPAGLFGPGFIDPASGAQIPAAGLTPEQANLSVSGHPGDTRVLATQGPDAFDVNTGAPLAPAAPVAPRFDPNTGQQITTVAPVARFDPTTGQPLS
jgi:hypothetical protein